MSLGGYETSFIVSGLALAGAGLLPQAKVKERLTFAAIGVGMVAYAMYVSAQTSGTYYFPIQLLVLPWGLLAKLLYDNYANGRSAAPTSPRAATTVPAPIPQRPAPAAGRFCPHCGSAVEPGFAKCGNCRQLVQLPGAQTTPVTFEPCPHCGSAVEPGFAKCGNCRQLIPGTVATTIPTGEPCPHCGSVVEPGFAKCGNCRQLVQQPGV